MALCRYTDQQLQGPGSRVAVEHEVAKLADLAKPFGSLEEVKRSAAKRLMLQDEADRKANAAVEPSSDKEAEPGLPAGAKDSSGPTSARGRTETPRRDHQVQPEQKKKYVTMPLGNGRTLFAHPATWLQKGKAGGSRFAELVADEDEETREEKTEDNLSSQEVIDISSDNEQAAPESAPKTEVNKSNLHIVKAKPHKLHKPPQLIALKQRERVATQVAIEKEQRPRGPLRQVPDKGDTSVSDFAGIEKSLEIREVNTPPSGNCMAMAIAQALADSDLAGETAKLEELTKCVKKGIRWTAQLHMADQFSHFVRTTTLVNLKRGWEGMEAHESMKLFKWYLDDYASSPSGREDFEQQKLSLPVSWSDHIM